MKKRSLLCLCGLVMVCLYPQAVLASPEVDERLEALTAEIDGVISSYDDQLKTGASAEELAKTRQRLNDYIEEKKHWEHEKYISKLGQDFSCGNQIRVASGGELPARQEAMAWPCQSRQLTSAYGMRQHPILHVQRMHHGIDIAGSGPIYAAEAGQVTKLGYYGGYGYMLEISHADQLKTRYAHLKSRSATVKLGDQVDKGQLIAEMGTTGLSTGVHLHFEVYHKGRTVDPLLYIK